jgi:VanZ family protein
VPVILLCTLIFIMSSNPYPESIPGILFLDKLIHFFVYGMLGILFFRAVRERDSSRFQGYSMILGIALSSLYGISDEIHQYFTPDRVADLYDVTADILGSLTGVLLYQFFIHKYYASFPYHSHMDKIEILI